MTTTVTVAAIVVTLVVVAWMLVGRGSWHANRRVGVRDVDATTGAPVGVGRFGPAGPAVEAEAGQPNRAGDAPPPRSR